MSDDARILAGRYEVGDLIGRGGMAEVHIGYDTRLGRTVAIKVLRADLARDPSFQTRFRREAQAAAGLNHPSIVAVYDTGEDTLPSETGRPQAVPFIVMEYVEGHTVRDILKGDVAAPIDEAIEIVAGVLSALDYSHHAGLVHRDIKPANVMLTPTGAVKVMDFGIARALADAGQTMTQTQAVVGTAQYLSPEQARGENVDARSDLYSTGCLLFELLTGRPPFIGDSPVSVAYQHVREEAPRPSKFASDVPEELDQVVLRALAKDRNARYSSATEFLADLRAVSAGEPVSPTTGSIGIGAAALGSAAIGAGAAGVAAAQNAPTQAMTQVGDTAIAPPPSGASPWATVQQRPVSAPPAPPGADENESGNGRSRQFWILGGAALAAIVLIWALFYFTSGNGSTDPSAGAVEIPALDGKSEADAVTALEDLGLKTTVSQEPSETVEAGIVIRTEPPAGESVPAGDTVVIVVSSGADVIEIPSVRGLTKEDAVAKIEAANLRVTTFDTEDDPDIEEGRVTKTDPEEGQTVAANSGITLFTSTGKVEVPLVVGKTEEEARAELTKLRLVPSIQRVETSSVEAGVVFKQTPRSGTVDPGTEIQLQVAATPTTAAVPDVVGAPQASAEQAIRDRGFNPVVSSEANASVPSGSVIRQSPDPGTQLKLGESVRIVVSTGP